MVNATPNFRPFDAAEYLRDEEMMADYLDVAAADPNPDVFLAALRDVAKARGMAEIARASGLGRESLYKALAPGAKPRYETIARIVSALGIRIAIAKGDLPDAPEDEAAVASARHAAP